MEWRESQPSAWPWDEEVGKVGLSRGQGPTSRVPQTCFPAETWTEQRKHLILIFNLKRILKKAECMQASTV